MYPLTLNTEDIVRAEAFLRARQESEAKQCLLDYVPSAEDFERAEEILSRLPQAECPLDHRFAPGIYMREIEMPAGTFVIGAEHVTEHFNVVLTGRAYVMMNGVIYTIAAPCTFVSKPGVRKVLYILETMRWQTIHPNSSNETDIDKLEQSLVRVTPKQRWLELGVSGIPTRPLTNATLELAN